jgi:hypothetical protein
MSDLGKRIKSCRLDVVTVTLDCEEISAESVETPKA